MEGFENGGEFFVRLVVVPRERIRYHVFLSFEPLGETRMATYK